MAEEQRKRDLTYGRKLTERSQVTQARKILPVWARDLILVSLPYDSFCEMFASMQSHTGRLHAGLWLLDAGLCIVAPYEDAWDLQLPSQPLRLSLHDNEIFL